MSNQYSDRVSSYYALRERSRERETECCEVNSKCEIKKQGKEDRVHSQCDIMGKMWR